MRKVMVIMVICSLLAGSASAQGLDHLPELERNKILIERAEEAVLKYGPGYYRNELPPIIESGTVTEDRTEFPVEEVKKKFNRKFYTVEYQYDKSKESFVWYFPAKIYIWANTGLVFRIDFGNGRGFAHLDQPASRSASNHPIMPFGPMPPIQSPAIGDETPTETLY